MDNAFIPASKASRETRVRLPKLFFPGQVIQFNVINANKEKNRIILSLLFEEPKPNPKILNEGVIVKNNEKQRKNSKKTVDLSTENKSRDAEKGQTKLESKRKSTVEDLAAKKAKKCENIPKRREEKVEENLEPPKKKQRKNSNEAIKVKCEVPRLDDPGVSFYDVSYLQEQDNSDSELSSVDDFDSEKAPKPVKKKKKGKAKEDWARESEIRKVESKLADPLSTPSTVDDFVRLVIASPNSSMAWSAYIAFVLQGGDIENARAIVARALKTILFREEEERENIWKVWMNMEASFGTEDSLKSTFTEALKANDPLAIYKTMCEIYQQKNNYKEFENTLRIMLKKFSQKPEVWFEGLTHYYKAGEFDKGRDMFKSCLEKMPKTDHITMISKTAILEMKYGDIERGRTLLDTTLKTYPKRLDIWLLYTAQLIKKGEYEMARDVFQNAAQVPFVPKRMLTVLKKFLQFEIEHGTSTTRAKVKEIALEYVNSVDDPGTNFLEGFED